MKYCNVRQNYSQALKARIEFQVAVALFLEFDYETKLLSEFSEIDQFRMWDDIKVQILKFEEHEIKEDMILKGDYCLPCMAFASLFRKSPNDIANVLRDYVLQIDGIAEVKVVNGYLNIFFDRTKFIKGFIAL